MDLTESVDHVRPCIVQVNFLATHLSQNLQSQLNRPFVSSPLGTGFLVNSEGYVITANHVIDSGQQLIQKIDAGQKQVYVGLALPNTENMRGNFSLVNFELVDKDERHDLALLKLRKNPFRGEVSSGIVVNGKEVPLLFGIAILNTDRPKDGAYVAISGYPLGQTVLVTNAGWMATSWALDIKEIAASGAPEWFRMPDIADTYLADVEANPGNSGGPVYLGDNGSVIGVCVGSLGAPVWDEGGRHKPYYSSGLTMVVPIRYAIDLLSKHGLNWSKATR
jgi:S1-C subfamily serine protease